MKRILNILLVFLLCFSVTACSKSDDEANESEINDYEAILEKMASCNDFKDKSEYYDTKLVLNTINDEIRYDVIINNPTEEMKNIKALCYVEEDDDSTVPSLGILESEVFCLKPDYVDQEKNYYKGINLSGTTTLTSFHVDLYVEYEINNQVYQDYLRLTAK